MAEGRGHDPIAGKELLLEVAPDLFRDRRLQGLSAVLIRRSKAKPEELRPGRFRSVQRTRDRSCGRLSVRKTNCATAAACWYDWRQHVGG